VRLIPPIDSGTEVWASGVTYERSRQARGEESGEADIYDRVYTARRPELFFKAPAWRVVTHGEPVAFRADSALNVPEPELALVANAHGEVLGYCVCDDVSSRSIEGENALYLPQAKVYAGSCALSPLIRPAWSLPDLSGERIVLCVLRAGAVAFEGAVGLASMRRDPAELVRYLFASQPFPDGAVLGAEGQGVETALRSFQLTRIALPGMLCGVLDSGLRLAQTLAVRRMLYGEPVSALPVVRARLADAFVDLLISDCCATVAARGVHLVPEQAGVHASAVKYQISGHLLGAMNSLSTVLGANFYLRDGRYGMFQKLLRDLKPAGFGHAARVACLTTVLPQLPVIARRGWAEGTASPAEMFRTDTDPGPLPFERLRLSGRGRDGLLSALSAGMDRASDGGTADGARAADLSGLLDRLRVETEDLRLACAELRPSDVGVDASPRVLGLAARYAALLAASACLNVWLEAGAHGDPSVQDPAWLIAALHRLTPRPGRPAPASIGPVREHLYSQLAERHAAAESFDLSRRALSG
jgi:hypothetical protein